MRTLPAGGKLRVPVLVWGRHPPLDALRQLERIAAQPYVVLRVAAMPDLHLSSEVSVGTVFATEDAIVPAALGNDLGCGVSALELGEAHAWLDERVLREWLVGVSRRIPVSQHGFAPPFRSAPVGTRRLSTGALEHVRERLVPRQLGTLGEGNHFVELDRDAEGRTHLLVHSGSRGLGGAISAHHAKAALAQHLGAIPALRRSSDEGARCWADLHWAFAFARANREAMAGVALEVLGELTGLAPQVVDRLDVQHNFVAEEVHEGRSVLVHRKGAICAARGARALIPGSMGTASYWVEGLGEPLSLCSASHGAGRVLTRREARRKIRPAQLERSMSRVIFDTRRAAWLVEEAPAAYREIREVLDDETDLVRPQRRLEPLAVLKG